ncbi:MAG: hypothetical protein EPN97_03620, partial [Alphaproteobacteria bacterium]
MKFPFRKKPKAATAEAKPVADAAAQGAEAKPADETPGPAQSGQVIRELLNSLAQEKAEGVAEIKLLRAAFFKASRAVLEDEALANEENVKALEEYTKAVKNPDLRADAVSALGSLALRYPAYGDRAIQVLAGALNDTVADVRCYAVFGLNDLGQASKERAATVTDMLVAAAASPHNDVREAVMTGLTALAVKYENCAGKAVQTLAGALAANPTENRSAQGYMVRNKAAEGLGEIGLAHASKLDDAIKGLTPALADKDIFVQYRVIDALHAIGLKNEPAKDGIIASLEKTKEGAIYVVKEKISGVISSLRPPAKPEKTPEEAEAERVKAEERRQAAESAAAKQAEATRQKL